MIPARVAGQGRPITLDWPGHQLFRDPAAFNEDGSVKPHTFVDGTPEYAACLACGAAHHGKVQGKPIHPR
jgi:hypothetical protein